MKKILSLMLAVFLLIGLVACAGNDNASPTPSATTSAPPAQGSSNPEPAESESPHAGLPITAEKTEISIWATWGNASIPQYLVDWNDAIGFQSVEEKTNIHPKWTIPTYGSESETFNILIASNDYPDIIQAFTTYYANGLEHAMANDIIIRLDDVIASFMPNYWSRISVTEERMKNVKTDTGAFAAIYKIMSEKQNPWGGQSIRKDWLDKLGMQVPETYDELHDVLVAFRDVIGASKPMMLGSNGDTFGYAMAGGFGAANTMMQINGKVVYGPMLPEFKEYIALTKAWYDEGLIDRDFTSSSPFDFAPLFGGDTGYAFGFATVGTFEEIGGASPDPDYNAIGIANPVKNKGETNRFGILATDVESGHVITTQCDQIEICARWMDYLYSDEGSIAINFGSEGETFFFDEEGYPTIDAAALEAMYGAPISSLQMVTGPVDMAYYSIKYKGNGLKKQSFGMNNSYTEAGQTWQKADGSALIPNFVTMTADEAQQYNAIYNDANTLVTETVVKIITGSAPIESYDDMVATLNGMGIDKCIAIQQGALDRYNGR